MPRRCVAMGCSHQDNQLYQWPSKPSLSRQWTAFVQLKRKQWSPSLQSVLCSCHFKEESFKNHRQFKEGLSERLLLDRQIAVPTIHTTTESKSKTPSPSVPARPRSAYKKRERSRLFKELSDSENDHPINKSEESLDMDTSQANVLLDVPLSSRAPQMVSKSTQTRKSIFFSNNRPRRKTIGTQTSGDIDDSKLCSNAKRKRLSEETTITEDVLEDSISSASDSDDEDYDPHETCKESSDSDLGDSSSECDSDADSPKTGKMEQFNNDAEPFRHPKYIVFHNQLLMLLSLCLACYSTDVTVTTVLYGSMLIAYIKCSCCKAVREWRSQPSINRLAAGDILLSSSILFSGALPRRVIRIFKSINIACIQSRSFFRHQKNYLHNVVRSVWITKRNALLESLRGVGLVIGGDGRCDSMGHSAKYGCYTTVDLERNKVLNVELVQSNEVTSSNAMELEGLKRMVQLLKRFGLTVNAFVTDRHKQIQKWVREQWANVTHYFDCWHVGKSIKKKLKGLAARKPCALIGEWMKSIINHFYWSVKSTEKDDKAMIEAKWLSVLRHIQNIHEGHGEPYPKCLHKPLSDTDKREIKWLKQDTDPFDSLEKIVTNKSLVADIKKCSPIGQTSTIEGYHSLINQFAPKMHHFSYKGMKSRLYIAAMHYNENAGRKQQKNKRGDFEYAICYPKYKKGGHIVRKILSDSTYDYVEELFTTLSLMLKSPELFQQHNEHLPQPLCATYEQPSKLHAVAQHTSRFN